MKTISSGPFKTKYLEGWEVRIPYHEDFWCPGDVWGRDRKAKEILVDLGITLLGHTYMSGKRWKERSPESYYQDAFPQELVITTCREIKQ